MRNRMFVFAPDDGAGSGGEGNGDGKPTSQNNGDNSQTTPFDPSKVSDDDFGKVFEDKRVWNHPRFKELNEKAKKAEAYEKEKAEAEEARLKEQNKFQELATLKETEANEYKSKYERALQDQAIQATLHKEGVVDAEAALVLLDRSNIKVGTDGKLEGVEDAIKALKEAKAYLFGTTNQKLGGDSNPAPGQGQGRTFTRSQLRDSKFFQENKAEILEAAKHGRIVEDGQRV